MAEPSGEFKKLLGRWDSVAIMIAIVIGVGIFRVPAEVASYLKSPIYILLAWLIGGVISLFGAMCYAELASTLPRTGGDYIYLRESYGPLAAFLLGWTEFLVIRGGSIAAVAFIFAEYLRSFLDLSAAWVKPSAVILVLAIMLINTAGLRHGRRVQTVFTVTKVVAFAAIIVLGIFSGKGDASNFLAAPAPLAMGLVPAFGLALIPILWTYGGWHEGTFVAGETRNAVKSLPFALITGVIIITAIYVAINALYIYLIPAARMPGASLIASDVLQILCGKPGRKVLEALVIVSSVGSINAQLITGSRITYVMAKDNAMFRYMAKADPDTGSPARAVVINGVWAAILVELANFDILMYFTGILMWLFIALVTGGIFILRRRLPDSERPHKAWGYPVVPIVFLLVSISLFVNTVVYCPGASLAGLCLLLSGVPVYIISRNISVPPKQ